MDASEDTSTGIRTTRRRVLAVVTASMPAGLLAACAPRSTGDRVPDAPKTIPPATLQLWTIWGGARLGIMNEQLANFSRRFPGITVEHLYVTGDDLKPKVLTAMAGGTPPDVPTVGRQEIPMFVDRVAGLTPLDALMERDKVSKSAFYDGEINGCLYDGKTWALPFPTAGTEGLMFYNREWLTREGIDPDRTPPRTWDQLQDIARRTTVISGGKTVKLGIPMDIRGLNFWHWLGLAGGRLWSPDGRRMLLDRAEDTLQWMVEFRDKLNGGRDALQDFPPRAWRQFYDGNQAHVLATVGVWYEIRAEAPDVQLGVYVRPARNDDGGKCIALEAWSYAIAKGSKSPEAAWALMRFLTVDKDGGGWFMNQQTRPSPVKEFNQNPELRQRNPYWDVLVRSLDRSAPPGTFLPVHGELVTVINENVTRLEQGQYSVRDTAAAMRQDGQRILDGFWAAKRK